MSIRYILTVRNIPWTVSHFDLEKHFVTFGDVKNAKVMFNKLGISTGNGLVEFYDKETMNRALHATHFLEEHRLFVQQKQKPIRGNEDSLESEEVTYDRNDFIEEEDI